MGNCFSNKAASCAACGGAGCGVLVQAACCAVNDEFNSLEKLVVIQTHSIAEIVHDEDAHRRVQEVHAEFVIGFHDVLSMMRPEGRGVGLGAVPGTLFNFPHEGEKPLQVVLANK